MSANRHAFTEDRLGDYSAVIPTKDRPEELRRLLTALFDQSLQAREIIVVDQSLKEECAVGVKALLVSRMDVHLPKLVYIHDPSIDGLTAARNVGLRHSTTPVVMYFDDDGVPDRAGALLLMRALESRPDLLAVGGVITSYRRPSSHNLWPRRIFWRGPFWDERQPVYWGWARYARGAILPTSKLNGGFMAFRREVLKAVGGFDENYRGSSVGEDIEVSQRLKRWAGRPDALALVGGAYMTHESCGEWKRTDRSLEFEIVAMHYLFRKNLAVDRVNYLRLGWMMFGILLLSLIASSRRLSLGPLRSFGAGIRCVAGGYRDCPFLKSDHSLDRVQDTLSCR